MLKKIALGLGALVVLVTVIGALLPREWHVEESVLVAAPPERIHPHLHDLQKWQAWIHDPAVPREVQTITTPSAGKGAAWSWSGKNGRGTLTLTDSNPALGVTFDEKIESDEVNAHGSITYAVEGAHTKVTWKDDGTLPPVIGGFFRSMIQSSLSDHFGKALGRLKVIAEAAPATPEPSEPAAPSPAVEAADAGEVPAPDAG